MNRRVIDPAQLKGEALTKWYLRSPEELDEERRLRQQAEYEAFFGSAEVDDAGDPAGSWEEARVSRPRAREPHAPRPARPDPVRDRAPPVDGMPQPPGALGSFFGTHSTQYVNPTVPAPLDRVEPSLVVRGRYRLSDGTTVNAAEIERIYAEQRRRARGEDEFEPAAYVRVGDRLKDGRVPRAEELAKGEREVDRTCHPNGGWEPDPYFKHYSQRTQEYEDQIAQAPGLDYVVRNPGENP